MNELSNVYDDKNTYANDQDKTIVELQNISNIDGEFKQTSRVMIKIKELDD